MRERSHTQTYMYIIYSSSWRLSFLIIMHFRSSCLTLISLLFKRLPSLDGVGVVNASIDLILPVYFHSFLLVYLYLSLFSDFHLSIIPFLYFSSNFVVVFPMSSENVFQPLIQSLFPHVECMCVRTYCPLINNTRLDFFRGKSFCRPKRDCKKLLQNTYKNGMEKKS